MKVLIEKCFFFLRGRTGSFALLLLLVGWAYAPSLLHLPRHDQVAYWAETAHKEDLYSLTVGSYALNRGRLFNPVDDLLFRPFLYFFLGLEKWLFGHHFPLWQATGIILHMLCVWRLWRLLDVIRPGVIAFYMSAFFALLLVNVEMVIWQNINAYIIACILFLWALQNIALFLRSGARDKRRLFVSVCVLIMAAFFYEVAAVFSFCCFLVFLTSGRLFVRYSWAFLLPAFFSFAASSLDLLCFSTVRPFLSEPMAQWNFWQSVYYFFLAAKWSLVAGIFSWAGDLMVFFRTVMPDRVFSWAWPWDAFSFFALPGYFLLLAVLIFLRHDGSLRTQCLGIRRDPVRWHLVCLLGMCLLAYWVVIAFGRMGSRGVLVGLGINLYYLYVVWLLLVVLAYVFFIPLMERWASKSGSGKSAVKIIFLVFVLWNAFNLRLYNTRMAEWQQPLRKLLSSVQVLLQEHGNEPGFSFFVDPDFPGNIYDPWLRGRNDPPERKYRVVEAVYMKYFKPDNPAYVISFEK